MQYQIPKRIIQTGKRVQQSLRNRAAMANIRLLNPDYEYLFFDDEGVERFIDQEFPQYRELFDSFPFLIQRYDFFRYLVVYRYGGFYFDLDVILACPLDSLLEYGCLFPFEGLTLNNFLRSQYKVDWEMGNYAFGAVAEHPFLNAVIENCVRAQRNSEWVKPMMRGLPFFFREEFLVLNTTGPGLLSRTLAENKNLAKGVTVLFPDDVCDMDNWNRFGDFGVHLMEGSWRIRTNRARRRVAQRWENWKMQGLLKQSRSLGKTRQHPMPNSTMKSERDRPTKTSDPLVSILIPAFNAQEWISDTILSALAQTWKSKEIIVVDDGSTDHTLRIAQQFESENVQVVTQTQQGASAARNKAFSLCQGDYIQWLDADDLLAPDKIALQMAVAKQCGSKKVLLSSAWGKFIYRHHKAKFTPTALWHDLSPLEWLLRKMGDNLYMQTAAWLVSRELSVAAGAWDTKLLGDDDGEYFCRVLLASEHVRFVPEAKLYYRGPGLAFRSLSHIGQSVQKIEAHWLSMQSHIGYLRSMEDSERVKQACLSYLHASLLYFYPERPEIVKQMEEMAHELDSQLPLPRLPWKYSWIKTISSWGIAKRSQQLLLKYRWAAGKHWDHALYGAETMTVKAKSSISHFLKRAQGSYQRASAKYLSRRIVAINPRTPIISFSFDDFPRSALSTGGAILQSYGLAGTYYVSLGLAGQHTPTGTMFELEDLKELVNNGHELGCHTLGHNDAWDTKPREFEDAIIKNQRAMSDLIPGISFKTLSYPKGLPRAGTKQRMSKHFACCRCGGQTFNVGKTDLNYLSAFFLEQSRGNPEAIKRLIDRNRLARGWLIFATHDVCEDPTPWGCTPELFQEILQYSVNSGAQILPVFRAYETLTESHCEGLKETPASTQLISADR
jgi:glycosyltransferase involved in cell wall biosynthesis/peptidoglycan/xylan/chitin deacetylase (PgdA/CDA1 family)